MGSRGENRHDCLRYSCNTAKSQILVLSLDYLSLVICKMGIMLLQNMSSSVPTPSPGSVLGQSIGQLFQSPTPPPAPLGVALADRRESLDGLSYEGHSEQSWASKPTWFDSKGNTLHSLPSSVSFASAFLELSECVVEVMYAPFGPGIQQELSKQELLITILIILFV